MYQALIAINSIWGRKYNSKAYTRAMVSLSFAEDGIMFKGNKLDFMVKLEGPLEGNITTIDHADAVMIDTSYWYQN